LNQPIPIRLFNDNKSYGLRELFFSFDYHTRSIVYLSINLLISVMLIVFK